MIRCSSLFKFYHLTFIFIILNGFLIQNSTTIALSWRHGQVDYENHISSKWNFTKEFNNDVYTNENAETKVRRKRQDPPPEEETPPPTSPKSDEAAEATTKAAAAPKPDTEATTPPPDVTVLPGGTGGTQSANQGNPTMMTNNVCNTKLFKRLDNCCPTPTLINYMDIQRCIRRSSVMKRKKRTAEKSEFYPRPNFQLLHNIIFRRGGGGGRRGGGGMMMNMGGGGGRGGMGMGMGNNDANWVAKGARAGDNGMNGTAMRPMRTDPTQVVGDDWTVNANMMFATMTALVPPAWGALVNTAKTECAAILGAGVAAMIKNPTTGGFCLQAPTKLMRCVKKTFIMGCPTVINAGPRCQEDMSLLKACDIHAI